MTMELSTKAQLQIINRRNNVRYPLDGAETDYFLALVSKIIYESPLKDKPVLKGGTALHQRFRGNFEAINTTAIRPCTGLPIGATGRLRR